MTDNTTEPDDEPPGLDDVTHVAPDADSEDTDDALLDDYRERRIEAHRDPLADDFRLGDVCVDLATGRSVQVVGLPNQTVAEWSGDNDYDLLDNYANERTRARPNDPVVECVYVSSVQSEPNGPRGASEGGYTFPSSRLARVTVESVNGVRRPYDAIAVDVLRGLFKTAMTAEWDAMVDDLESLARGGVELDDDVVAEARELADVEHRFGGSG